MTDETFLQRFEGCDFSTDEWRHGEHWKAAYLYLLRLPDAEALARCAQGSFR